MFWGVDMTFSYDVKNQLIERVNNYESLANFIIGIFISAVDVYRDGFTYSASFTTENHKLVEMILAAFYDERFHFKGRYSIHIKVSKKGYYRYYLYGEDIGSFLEQLGILNGYVLVSDNYKDFFEDYSEIDTVLQENLLIYIDRENNDFISKSIKSNKYRQFFASGLFVASGSVSNPKKSYHMELSLKNKVTADFIRRIVMSVFDVDVKLTIRTKVYSLYIKEKDIIADILSAIGANKSRLTYEVVMVEKDMNNKVNRIVNCDRANIKRATETSNRQISAIHKIINTIGLEQLDDKLREVATLRLEYPYMTLSELAEESDTSLTKSGINHRLNKLEKIASNL